ncbi:hypothetical protein FRC04_006897 [Tulasnella sp. 424]|nr:hypothetical protein FRC04_006897 [Tulasnella sp. 424]
MHHFWTIPEISTQVLDYLSNADRRAMIQVCQVLWAPTARLIWREVPRLSDLLRLFPEEHQIRYNTPLYDSREDVTLSGCLWASEWERFRLYSPFVKTLKITMDDQNYKALRRLHAYSKRQCLLPNLHAVDVWIEFSEWSMPLSAVDWVPICELLFGPTLKQMDCRHLGRSRDAAEQMLIPALDRLQSIPSLEKLCWTGGSISDAVEKSLCHFLSNTQHLRSLTLNTPNIPPAILLSASHTPALTTASFSKFQGAEYISSSHALFESLTDLECNGTGAGLDVAFHAVKAPKLNRISISMCDQRREGPNPFDILKDSERFPALADLRLKDLRPSWVHLEAILSLTNLKILHINSIVPEFDSIICYWPVTTIRRLAKSFPKLESLVLGDWYGSMDDPTVSLPDLECFAQFCPQLRQLTVSVDARRMEGFSGYLIPHPTLEEVDLGESLSDSFELEIAKVVHQLWPCLRRGVTGWEAIGDWRTPRWERIWKYVEGFRTSRSTVTRNNLDSEIHG